MRAVQFMLFLRCGIVALFSGLAIPVCLADCGNSAQLGTTSAVGDSPAAIQKLAKAIQGKKGDEVASAITNQFGPAARDVGSGVTIQQWDVESGVLTYSRGLVNFRDKGGKLVWLTTTVNKALPSLTADSFEMYTLPSPQMKYWLGNVSLRPDSTYRFTDSGSGLEHRADQTQNFFMRHPDGRFAIHFAPGCTADTVLEHLPDGTVLCRLTFLPADGGAEASYDVIAYASEKRLAFDSKRPRVFSMEKQWGAGN